jgi:transposase
MRDNLLRSTEPFVVGTNGVDLKQGWESKARKIGNLWVIAGDGWPWRGGVPPAVVYNYAPDAASNTSSPCQRRAPD